ncbi:hypothetical protein H4Q26_002239 [Puccinia striiformis f. sp. tritici PST-130]|nr:hypothetical protein H4Q26_002239 [Puccinia striiformis f. sp. tritici PST-130]
MIGYTASIFLSTDHQRVQNEQPNALDIPYSSAPKQLDHGGRLMMEAPAKKKARKTQNLGKDLRILKSTLHQFEPTKRNGDNAIAHLLASLFITILTLILSIYSLQAPTWIRFDTPSGSPFQYSSIYGLTQKCDKSNLHPEFQCRRFPQLDRDCQSTRPQSKSFGEGHTKPTPNPEERFGFCEQWITAAYTAQLSVIIAIINLFSTFLILIGNNFRKEHGWKICAGLTSIHAVFQSLAWILIINLFNKDDRFYFGSRLSTSTYLSIVTSVIDLISIAALVAAGFTGIFNSSSNDRDQYERVQ